MDVPEEKQLASSLDELELLDAIAAGQSSFNWEHSPNLNAIDVRLQAFAALGYVERVVRAVYPNEGCTMRRIDVLGGLTPVGEMRRRQLATCIRLPSRLRWFVVGHVPRF